MAKNGKPVYSLLDMFRDRANISHDEMFPIVSVFENYFRELDKEQFIGRYKLYNAPDNISQELIERELYYRGTLCFWYSAEMKKFYVTPFSFFGPPDATGNYEYLIPLPFHGAVIEKDENGNEVEIMPGLKKKIIKEVPYPEEVTPDMVLNGAVVLWDRPRGIGQTIMPRYYINEGIIGLMSEMPSFAKTSLLINTGIQGWQVNGPEDSESVDQAAQTVEAAALGGYPWIPVKSISPINNVTGTAKADSEQYINFMNTLDSLRLSGMGLQSEGITNKSHEYTNQTSLMLGQQNTGLIYNSGLQKRQEWADICNAVWQTSMYWDSVEPVTNFDSDGDGDTDDGQDQSGVPGEQPEGGFGNENY